MIRSVSLLLTLSALLGCEFRGAWKPGEVYSVQANDSGASFFICKVLAVDDDFVWLSVFTDVKFDRRPGAADLNPSGKWTVIWSTHGRMRQDAPELIVVKALTPEEQAALQNAKSMLHRK